MTVRHLMLLAPIALLAACADNEPVDPNADTNVDLPAVTTADNMANNSAAQPTSLTADFKGGDGTALGNVTAADSPSGLIMTLAGTGMPAGIHGIHLHSVGKCDGPAFESAGAHFNPSNKKHGTENPEGPHAGDLPNVTVAANGALTEVLTVAGLNLAQLRDPDGTALVIHAKADDNRTDPSGESGDRIACAIIAPAA